MRGWVRFAILTTGAWLMGLLSVNCWAEFRTWTAASGSYRTEAEFVELRDEGKVVHLRLKAGGERDVPLEKLSAADQDYVRSQSGKTAATNSSAASSSTSSDPRIADLQRRAGRCQSAEEALRLYRLFRDDPQTTDDQRRAILDEFEKLRSLADKKMMRKGGQWVSESEFKSVRAQANSLMKLGLELLRLKQEEGFRKKFAEAAAVEPDSIRADFLMGMLYTIHTNDLLKTKKYFEACLKRDPDNVCVLNNLALTSVKRNEAQNAVNYWQKAIALEPNQGIVQNLGRLLDLAGRKRLDVPKSAIAKVSEMYASLIGTEKYDGADAKRGWMYMLIDEESLSLTIRDPEKEKQQETSATAAPPPGEDGSVVVGGGTGFVVFPKYVLTNNHVVHGAASIEIQTSGSTAKQTLPAKVIATSEKPDLALVYCEGLDAPPLPLDPQLSRRGTEIMALGYPKMFDLGASLKATRGIISAVPSSAQEDMYLYDATVNPGNSGGPVFDNHGNVIAVTTILWRFESQYGGGLPSPVALEFIKKHLPLFAPTPLATETLDWQSVDQKVSPSTVLVWNRSKDPKATAAVAWSGYREDRDCLGCGGLGILRCPCRTGVITARRGSASVSVECPLCKGKKLLKCGACKGTGIDPDLVVVKKGSPPSGSTTRPPSGSSGSSSSPPPSRSPRPGDHPPLDAAVVDWISSRIQNGQTFDTPQTGTGGTAFRDVPEEGALLVGFVLMWEDASKSRAVRIYPIYQTKNGQVDGNVYGQTTGHRGVSLARIGYALGGLRLAAGSVIEGAEVVMMRVSGLRLQPNDAHGFGVRGGSPNQGRPVTIGMEGSLMIGITGTTSSDGRLSGVGLVSTR